MNILIAENRTDIKEDIIIALRIRWPEIEIIDYSNSKGIINTILDNDIDVVIVGEQTSGMSNNELIKTINKYNLISIIVIGSRVQSDRSLVKALEYGADEYIRYPFTQMELLSRINAIVRNKKLLFQNSRKRINKK